MINHGVIGSLYSFQTVYSFSNKTLLCVIRKGTSKIANEIAKTYNIKSKILHISLLFIELLYTINIILAIAQSLLSFSIQVHLNKLECHGKVHLFQ